MKYDYSIMRPVLIGFRENKKPQIMVSYDDEDNRFQGSSDLRSIKRVLKNNPKLHVQEKLQRKYDYIRTLKLFNYKIKRDELISQAKKL